MTWWLVLVLSIAQRALAHGPPVGATELVAHQGSDVSLVRLTRGFASAGADGMRFLCPESFGSNLLAPAAALAQGPMLVAGDSLFAVQPDGGVTLREPTLRGLEDAQRAACNVRWLDVKTDLAATRGLVDAGAPGAEATAPVTRDAGAVGAPSEGCGLHAAGRGSSALLVLLSVLRGRPTRPTRRAPAGQRAA